MTPLTMISLVLCDLGTCPSKWSFGLKLLKLSIWLPW